MASPEEWKISLDFTCYAECMQTSTGRENGEEKLQDRHKWVRKEIKLGVGVL